MTNSMQTQTSAALIVPDDLIDEFGAQGGLDALPASVGLGKPRLVIAQALSPQLNKNSDKYLRGTEVGDLCLSGGAIDPELYQHGVLAIPCHFATHHVHWGKVRGEAPIRDYGADDSILAKCRRDGNAYFLPNNDEIVLEATWTVLVADADDKVCPEMGWIEAVFIQHHSGWREANAWGKAIKNEAPIKTTSGRDWYPNIPYWRAWKLSTGSRQGKKGDWSVLKFDPGPTLYEIDPSRGLMALAKLHANAAQLEITRFQPDPNDRRTIEGQATRPAVEAIPY